MNTEEIKTKEIHTYIQKYDIKYKWNIKINSTFNFSLSQEPKNEK